MRIYEATLQHYSPNNDTTMDTIYLDYYHISVGDGVTGALFNATSVLPNSPVKFQIIEYQSTKYKPVWISGLGEHTHC